MRQHPYGILVASVLSFVGIVAWAGCIDSQSRSERADAGCTAGRTTGCVCSGGSSGTQVCRPDGSWGACPCDGGVSSDVDTGSVPYRPDATTDSTTRTDGTEDADRGGADADTGGLPSVTSPNFESALRARVGAKPNQNWQQFCDPSGRAVYDITQSPYDAAPNDGTDDSDALSDAMQDAVSDDPSGIVRIPDGTYRLDAGLEIFPDEDGVCIVGNGQNTVLDSRGDFAVQLDDKGWGTWDKSRRIEGVTVANFRVDGAGINSDLVPGKDILLANLWIEKIDGRALYHAVSGTTIRDVTVREVDGHGIGIDNGVLKMGKSEKFDTPTELKKRRAPNPIELRRIHVVDAGYDDHSGRHNIDFGSGANIHIDTFLAENSDGFGMKTPSVADVRMTNGLIKNSYREEYYINLSYDHEVSIDNVKFDADGGSPKDHYQEVTIGAGDVAIGEILVEEADERNLQIRDDASIRAETIRTRKSGGVGLLVNNDASASIKNLEANDNDGCDVQVRNAKLTVENLGAPNTCGDDIKRDTVQPPTLP